MMRLNALLSATISWCCPIIASSLGYGAREGLRRAPFCLTQRPWHQYRESASAKGLIFARDIVLPVCEAYARSARELFASIHELPRRGVLENWQLPIFSAIGSSVN